VIRAFLAVELSAALRAELAILQQDLKGRMRPEVKRGMRLTWPRPASIHLTFKFLGEIDELRIEPLRTALEPVIGGQQAVGVPLERLGVFPHLQRPRVVWVGPSEDWEKGAEAKRVAELQRAIEQACEGFGFPRETRPFSPHLTLVRIKLGERQLGVALARRGMLELPRSSGLLSVESVMLIQSELRPAGPVYTRLWEARLRS